MMAQNAVFTSAGMHWFIPPQQSQAAKESSASQHS
jgi:hypothetical protein